jgi:CRP-like cAMP-binding protein
MDKKTVLRQIHLFETISEESRSALADICIPKNIRKNEILFLEGDRGLSLYILVHGSIELFQTSADGRKIVLKVVKPGELFAEIILFEESRYPAGAMALKPSLVFNLPKHQFSCLLENERFRNEFIANLMGKLRYLANQIRYLSSKEVKERFLMFVEDQYGRRTTISSPLPKKAVAAAIGTTPETLSRILNEWKREGLVSWSGSTLTIDSRIWSPK